LTGFRYGADGRHRRRGMNAGVGASGCAFVVASGRFGSSGGGGAGGSSGGVSGAGGGAVVKNPGRRGEGAPRRYVLLRVKLLHLLLLQHEFLLLLLQPLQREQALFLDEFLFPFAQVLQLLRHHQLTPAFGFRFLLTFTRFVFRRKLIQRLTSLAQLRHLVL